MLQHCADILATCPRTIAKINVPLDFCKTFEFSFNFNPDALLIHPFLFAASDLHAGS